MRTRLPRFVGSALMVGGLVTALTACGGDDSTASETPSDTSPPASAATTDPSPSRTASAENSNAPAVPGPSLPPATSIPDSKKLPDVEGTRCETVNGPDGALHVIIFPGGSVDCAVVMPIAKEYGPKIATGSPQQVSGWDCGPSQTRGVLSRCTKGSDAFGFSIE
ncbi:hypothetical protein [Williamsia sp. 1138]|uniref:hypothetical protein n=1 Tax=Williamsia sp. 1138 TaxID=1903117 RepID=UPI00117DD8C5|nr:hypothetical protein [Williamsia sp. 1138]